MIKNNRKLKKGRKVNKSSFVARDASGKPLTSMTDYDILVSKINARFEQMKSKYSEMSLDELYHEYSEKKLSSTDRRALHEIYRDKVNNEYREMIEKGIEIQPSNKLTELYLNELKYQVENKSNTNTIIGK